MEKKKEEVYQEEEFVEVIADTEEVYDEKEEEVK